MVHHVPTVGNLTIFSTYHQIHLCVKTVSVERFEHESYKMYDVITYCFQRVIKVSHHTFYSSHNGKRSVANVYDDTLVNYSNYQL